MQLEIVKHPHCLNTLTGSTFIKVNHNRFHYLNEIKPERRHEKETVRRLMQVLMEDFLAGSCCPESPLENSISGFRAHIGNISSSNDIHVLCAHFLLWLSILHVHSFVAWASLSFVVVLMGSSAIYCKGRARWGKQTIPRCHCWLDGCLAVGRLLACTGICNTQKSSSVAPRDIPWALLPRVPRQQVQPQVRLPAESANLSHLLNNF